MGFRDGLGFGAPRSHRVRRGAGPFPAVASGPAAPAAAAVARRSLRATREALFLA